MSEPKIVFEGKNKEENEGEKKREKAVYNVVKLNYETLEFESTGESIDARKTIPYGFEGITSSNRDSPQEALKGIEKELTKIVEDKKVDFILAKINSSNGTLVIADYKLLLFKE